MRKTADRIRHAIAFEVIALALVTPLAAWAFDMPMEQSGIVGIGSAVVAATWAYLFNLGFDHAMKRLTGRVAKRLLVRVFHAILFEASLIAILLPPIAWYLGIGLWEALVLDAGISAFYVVYAFVFNLAYDRVFPIPGEAERAS